jgi:protein arginine N-methyltransferase 2
MDPAMVIDLDTTTQEILLAASNHDIPTLKPFLRVPGAASVQDPETGFTPLHSAIAACGSTADAPKPPHNSEPTGTVEDENNEVGEDEEVDLEKAKATLTELFLSGAIWNDLDSNNETPGCLAWRLGQKELYELVVDAGVRAEMLLNLMGGYEELDSNGSDEEDLVDEDIEMVVVSQEDAGVPDAEEAAPALVDTTAERTTADAPEKKDVNSADYLKSDLTFTDDKLLDADANGVMMSWETSIMELSSALLAPTPGLRILNIGFGMGIVDRLFAATNPSSHHIIEAHPAVLSKLREPTSDFGAAWESSAAAGKNVIHAGRWQDIVPKLIEQGEIFDAIYFDTFGESYAQLKMFFSEYVVGLLDGGGRFGFFNGLGADRRVCYDVYFKVADLDLCDAGFETQWLDVEVGDLGGEGEGEWEGVRRRYWTLDTYRLPICTFMG